LAVIPFSRLFTNPPSISSLPHKETGHAIHARARTMPAIRQETKGSPLSDRKLAAKYNISRGAARKTVRTAPAPLQAVQKECQDKPVLFVKKECNQTELGN